MILDANGKPVNVEPIPHEPPSAAVERRYAEALKKAYGDSFLGQPRVVWGRASCPTNVYGWKDDPA
jgi:hypothetical protein